MTEINWGNWAGMPKNPEAEQIAEQAAAIRAEQAKPKTPGKKAKYPLATMKLGDVIEVPLAIVPDQNYRKFKIFLSNKGWALQMKFRSNLDQASGVIQVQRFE